MTDVLDITTLVTIPVHGGTVTIPEMPGCRGHHNDSPTAAEDVSHGTDAVVVTAQCDDGPLGVMYAFVEHRPLDFTTPLAGGPKLVVTFDEEADAHALDLDAARKLQRDLHGWMAGFDHLVDLLAVAVDHTQQAGGAL